MANISVNDITTSNETGTATFTVTLSEAVGSDVTVDFTTSSQTLNFTKAINDTSADGFQEVYWKTNNGDIYLRSLMHADGNIQYANYQNQAQMSEYLINQGHESVISDII